MQMSTMRNENCAHSICSQLLFLINLVCRRLDSLNLDTEFIRFLFVAKVTRIKSHCWRKKNTKIPPNKIEKRKICNAFGTNKTWRMHKADEHSQTNVFFFYLFLFICFVCSDKNVMNFESICVWIEWNVKERQWRAFVCIIFYLFIGFLFVK